jgi:serine/threonine protein kinase
MYSSFIGKVLDNYRILERLGIGGMGVVFKAIHIKLDKVFALKIIAPGLSMNEHFIKRFQTEAKALAKFEDPNIVRIYDLRSVDDQWFIVMEFVQGITLTDKILKDGAFHWLEALPIIKQILGAIGHAHEAGIIHRDIKPNNIMISDKGIVKITDFGLAKDQTTTSHTVSATSGGTLYYMSPEHVKGFSFIDARSDLYSIGMTFYEMLTGIVPFLNIKSDFDIRETIIRKEFDKPRSINPTIPPELEMIIMKSISKNPDDRFQTADDMMQAILHFEKKYDLAGSERTAGKEPVAKVPVVQVEPPGETDNPSAENTAGPAGRGKKRPVLKLAGALLLIAIMALVLFKDKFFPGAASATKQVQDEETGSRLTISSTPISAWIILNGDSLGQTPLINHILAAGQYSLKISKDKYNSIDTTIFLTKNSDLAMVFTLPEIENLPVLVQADQVPVPKQVTTSPVFAVLSIQSDPPGSEVWLNGEPRGKTPLYLTRISQGTYLVEIRREGYEKYTRDLQLLAGNNQSINARLTPLSGGLSVTKDPSEATVLLDGKKMDSQNLSVLNISNLPIGKHQVEIANPGYASFTKEIEIEQNEIYTIDAKLVRQEGNLNIQVRPWGSIYINNQLQKSTADIKYTVRLPVGQYNVRVGHPTLGIWQKTVQVYGDKETNVIVNFTQELPIKVNTVDDLNNLLSGEIYVDGKKIEQSRSGEILLRVGLHKVAVKRDGYYAEGGEKEILVDTGVDNSLTFILKQGN